jgi:uncharacterized membrane protein
VPSVATDADEIDDAGADVQDDKDRGRQLDRVNAFSDGVFSIAATLLVLSIDVPSGPASQLPDQLRALEGPLTSYFISFAVVGVFWYHHHKLLGRVVVSNTGFAALNLLFLSFVALLPAPTELLGRYNGQTAPVVIYAVNVLILTTLSNMLAHYAATHDLVDRPPPPQSWISRWSPFVAFGASIPIAFVAPREAVYVWVLSALLPRLVDPLIGRARAA